MRTFPVWIKANLETGLTPGRKEGGRLPADCELIAVDPGYTETTNTESLLSIVLDRKGTRAGRIFKSERSKVCIVGFKGRGSAVRDHHVISQYNNIGSRQDKFSGDVKLEITVN